MTSNLTRRVFRSILANEPILHRGCPRRRHYGTTRRVGESRSISTAHNGNGRCAPPSQQKRSLFNLSMFGGGKNGNENEADLDPGVEKMMEYVKRERMNARLPPPEEVASALNAFFRHKYFHKHNIEDTQAELATKCLRYCLESGSKIENRSDSSGNVILLKALEQAVRRLRWSKIVTTSHVELAKLIYDAMSVASPFRRYQAAIVYVRALAQSGHALEARQLVLELEAQHDMSSAATSRTDVIDEEDINDEGSAIDATSASSTPSQRMAQSWVEVLRGFAMQDSEMELLETLEMVRARGVISIQVPTIMLRYYLRGDNVDQVKTWFDHFWLRSTEVTGPKTPKFVNERAKVVRSALHWCLTHQELDFGHHVVRQALDDTPAKAIWDAVFVWAAGTGKGADEIDRMFNVMEASNKSLPDRSEWNVPDIATINALVEYATSTNDPYLAERFIAIGKARDIHPDANTYVLQMKYRLKISDIDGALIAYKNLQSMDLSSNDDAPTVNELIVALCKSTRHDFDTIMNVAADLSDRKVKFEPATASALALLHLNRDEIHDVNDLMNTHAYHYSTAERELVRRDLVAYCLEPKTPLSRVWDAYNVLAEAFDEMPRDERTQIMLIFFRRERPDVAVNIFNSMRSHYRDDTIPTIDTYVAAFLASAKLRDLDSLEVIHNQLKLDYNIDTTTYLLNALIIGYSACGNPRRALTFWDDIVASKEGPTYSSIHIALRACEKSPFGDLRAEKIWARLKSMDVDLDQPLWASYVAALAGNGNTVKAITTLEDAESKGELEMDSFVVGSLFNGCPGQVPQADVESWCKERYPRLWEQLENTGVDKDENGMRAFRIDRTVTP